MKAAINYCLIIVCGLIFIIHGCTSGTDNKEYINYFQDKNKGLIKSFSQNGLEIICSFKTGDYLYYKEKTINDSMSSKNNNLNKNYKNNIYCTLDFSIYGQQIENGFLKNERLHSACLNYLNNYVYKDVLLCTEKDTLPAIANSYFRQYGATKYSSVLIVFSKDNIDLRHGFDIIYQGDKFGIAPVRFTFTAEAVNNIPVLTY